ncbi:hypothetical protein D3C85_1111410 [compost metagenome]
MYRRLGHAVGNIAGTVLFGRIEPGPGIATVLADHRTEVDDGPLAAFGHQLADHLARHQRALHVDAHDPLVLGYSQIQRAATRDDPRHVDQRSDFPEVLFNVLNHAAHGNP